MAEFRYEIVGEITGIKDGGSELVVATGESLKNIDAAIFTSIHFTPPPGIA